MGCKLLLKDVGAGCDIGFPDSARVRALLDMERNGIASAHHAYRLSIDGRGAVLANHSARPFVEAHGAANLAGIEYGGNFAVRLLVQPKANRNAILFGFEAV